MIDYSESIVPPKYYNDRLNADNSNSFSFLLMSILVQLQQTKSKHSLRSLFERLDQKGTG